MLALIKAELAEDDELEAQLDDSLGEDDLHEALTHEPMAAKQK